MRLALVVPLAAALALPAQDVTIAFKSSQPLTLEGNAPRPDGTRLSFSIACIGERMVEGRVGLEATEGEPFGPPAVAVMGNKFTVTVANQSQGLYRAKIGPYPPSPDGKGVQEISVAAWDDKGVSKFGEGLNDFGALLKESRGLYDQFVKATQSEAAWKKAKAGLMEAFEKFGLKITSAPLYPASLNEMFSTLSEMSGRAESVRFVGGKVNFQNIYEQKDKKDPVDHRGQKFALAALPKYFAEVEQLAGREFALWLVKDARLRKGDPALLAAEAAKQAKHPGVAPFAGRLQKLKTEDLVRLEKDIRGEK